jgi:LysR family transcriptional activator of nhaA
MDAVRHLNYHHLRYFWAIAREGNLTRAARQLRVSQSALSIQLRQLEQALGHPLFERESKSLVLTEAGRLVLGYAETIFRTGEELLDAVEHRPAGKRSVLRVGAVATLSRNFQLQLLRGMLRREDVELVIRSGSLRELLALMGAHALDLVLSNRPAARDAESPWHNHLIDEQPVTLVGPPPAPPRSFRFPADLDARAIILPSLDSNTRADFDLACEQARARPVIVAEVDDMAMLRLLAREGRALALVPRVVVADELRSGVLVEHCRVPGLVETFYAITATRKFPNALVRELLTGARGSRVDESGNPIPKGKSRLPKAP